MRQDRPNKNVAGPVQAVIFDWAGTMVDFGSFAPTQVLIDAFAGFGIEISLEEARGPMGLAKWDHIKTLGQSPDIARRWIARHGSAMTDKDVDALYAAFLPLQIERVGQYSSVIPGALDTIAGLRKRGIKVGSCTGYPRVVMNPLLDKARGDGLVPDHAVATDDLKPGGRPGPWMALANVIELGITELSSCVKVDDTAPGIVEGLAAHMWTVGVALSGNEVGLTLSELERISDAEREQLKGRAAEKLFAAGAHYVIDTIADLPQVIVAIEERLAHGDRP
jgi:phosphonoacetaldehyde hydrolase